MRYKIISTGNEIVADADFMERYHANDFEQIVEPPVVERQTVLTKREFLKRFTMAEYAAVKTEAAINPSVDYFWQLFMLAEFISLDDTDAIGGVQALEVMTLIAPGRAAEILA